MRARRSIRPAPVPHGAVLFLARVRLAWLLVAAALAFGLVLASAPSSLAGELVFVSDTCLQGGPCRNSIWSAGDDGTSGRRVTGSRPEGNQLGHFHPSWSGDGRNVVFESAGQVVVVPAGGGQPQVLTPREMFVSSPAWSPREDVVAFGGHGTGAAGLPDVPTSFPFGVEDSDVFLVNSDGSGLRRIVNGAGSEDLPRFSDAGDRIIFRRASKFAAGDADELAGWYSVRPDGSDERRLTVGLPPVPHYSPDGRFIAVVNAFHDLYTMRSDGTDVRRWPGFAGESPTWSPFGPTLYYETGSVNAIDFAAAEPRHRTLFRTGNFVGAGLDWTDGVRRPPPPDRTPPATLLLAPDLRPLALARPQVRASARAGSALSVKRESLHFFAVDQSGIQTVEAAIARKDRTGRCRFLGARRFGRARACKRPVFRRVRSDQDLRGRVAQLKRGTYVIAFRATDAHGNRTRRPPLVPLRLR